MRLVLVLIVLGVAGAAGVFMVLDGEVQQPVPTQNETDTPPQGRGEGGQTIPACSGQELTVSPVALDRVEYFHPLGSVHPPSHTFPSQHAGISVNRSTEWVRSPGDVYIHAVSEQFDHEGNGAQGEDYTVGFTLCEDVQGYLQHVDSVPDEFKERLGEPECNRPGGEEGRWEYCEYQGELEVEAGRVLGNVSGVFDFGMYDYRKPNDFVSPDRYREDYLSAQCPLDYFTEGVRSALLEKSVTGEPECGVIAHDVPGTLAGNWFHDGEADVAREWNRHLAFLPEAIYGEGSTSMISIGGIFTEPELWHVLSPHGNGTHNRAFTDIAPDGQIYCYTASHREGRILVEMMNETALQVEHQPGECEEPHSFDEPYVYRR